MEYRNPNELKPHPISVKLYGDNHIDDIVESIRELGILEPLTITNNNKIISGHRRWRSAVILELDTVPVEIKTYEGELAEKRSILEFNCQRVKTFSQKMNEAKLMKDIVAEESRLRALSNLLQFREGHSPPSDITGKTAEIIGRQVKIGSERTYRKAEKIWDKAQEGNEQAIKLVKDIDTEDRTINGAFKELRDYEAEIQLKDIRSEMAKAGEAIPQSDRWCVEVADINTYQTDKQFDFIITDPPYPKEFLPLYEVLARRTSEWLKPDGLLITMCGQSYLDQIYEVLSKHLKYYWTAAYLTPGQPTPLRQRQVNSTWKPILIYSPTDNYKGKIFGDVYTSDKPEKDNHDWGQSVSGMLSIISQICLPGQTIFDPFLGSGSTGVAVLQHGCIFYGIDIDEQSVNISKSRLAKIK